MMTCAATLCFIPALELRLNYDPSIETPPVEWSQESISNRMNLPELHIQTNTNLATHHRIPSANEQKILKKALFRSIEIIHAG